jgi:ATP-dependent protease ClpP protease subunit
MRNRPKVFAKTRPGALPVPERRDVHALTRPEVIARHDLEAAGIRALASGDTVITMFDTIGEDPWSATGGVTAKKIAAQLRAIGDRPVEVQINSPGGDMFEGIAIYNVLREHPQQITVKVMGMAASAASIIAMAGDNVEIGAASFLMIHKCWVLAMGNADDMVETAEWLRPFDDAMAAVYAARSGVEAAEALRMMKAETWLSGQAAVDKGFADALLPSDKLTVDASAMGEDQRINKLRAMELKLMMTGESRSEARAHVNEIRGTTDSAPPAGTTDSAGSDLSGPLAGLLATLTAA